MFGASANPENAALPDLNRRELATLLSLILLSLWIGIYPAPLFRILQRPVENIISAVHSESRGGAYLRLGMNGSRVPVRTAAPESVSPAGQAK
jgi:hypothetical protein